MYQNFIGFLWISENIWYTFESETPRCTRVLRIFKKSTRFFVEGRTSRGGGSDNKNCHFLFFLISFLAFDADKTPWITSCQRILGA